MPFSISSLDFALFLLLARSVNFIRNVKPKVGQDKKEGQAEQGDQSQQRDFGQQGVALAEAQAFTVSWAPFVETILMSDHYSHYGV
jgi:hypothetical protein